MAVDWWLAMVALGALLVPLGGACWWLVRSVPPQPDDADVDVDAEDTVVARRTQPPRPGAGAQ